MIGVDATKLQKAVKPALPGFMAMAATGWESDRHDHGQGKHGEPARGHGRDEERGQYERHERQRLLDADAGEQHRRDGRSWYPSAYCSV